MTRFRNRFLRVNSIALFIYFFVPFIWRCSFFLINEFLSGVMRVITFLPVSVFSKTKTKRIKVKILEVVHIWVIYSCYIQYLLSFMYRFIFTEERLLLYSLKINSMPLNTCFSNRDVFKIASTPLSKMVLKNSIFCQKAQNFIHFGRYDLVQISPACGPSTYQIMYGDTLDFQCQHLQR